MRPEDLIRMVKDVVLGHGTKAIVIDDVTRLKLHREAGQDVLDLPRELMSLPVTLILAGAGIPKPGLLRDGRRDPRTGQRTFPPVKDRGKSRNDDAPGQTGRRFDLVDLDRFSYAAPDGIAAWTARLVGPEQQLRLLNGCDGSAAAPCPSTCPAAPTASSACSRNSSRKAAGMPSRPAPRTSPPSCPALSPSAPPACLAASIPMRARSPISRRRPRLPPGSGANRATRPSTITASLPPGPETDRR
jgi:hypothetical protein